MINNTSTFWMIYDNQTGLYSKGGDNPKFKKVGKIWNSIGALKNHLNVVISAFCSDLYGYHYRNNPSYLSILKQFYQENVYKNCVVIGYQSNGPKIAPSLVDIPDELNNIVNFMIVNHVRRDSYMNKSPIDITPENVLSFIKN